jgi:hypothetical protein
MRTLADKVGVRAVTTASPATAGKVTTAVNPPDPFVSTVLVLVVAPDSTWLTVRVTVDRLLKRAPVRVTSSSVSAVEALDDRVGADFGGADDADSCGTTTATIDISATAAPMLTAR